MWTSQDAMDLGVPIPTIDVAVSMRELSAMKQEREAAARVLDVPAASLRLDRKRFLGRLRNALFAAVITVYAQGMSLLQKASSAYGYQVRQAEVARIWRGGCIIRSAVLERIRFAFSQEPEPANLLVDPDLSREVLRRQVDLRAVVRAGAETGIPVPGLMASLGYFDAYRSSWLPANLIQAQRDYFGSHTYERVDKKGVFHTHWDAD
jgi:6-phosphogluconate dehydrogenase